MNKFLTGLLSRRAGQEGSDGYTFFFTLCPVIVIINLMIKNILFALEPETAADPAVFSEAGRAARSLKDAGFESGILSQNEGGILARTDPEQTLILCGCGEILNDFRRKGFYTAGYSHAGNAGDRFPGASYIIQEPDMVEADSYVKIFEREAGLPWTILMTRRCLVREFEVRDLDSVYSLYDSRARQFLEPPSEDRDREREILKAYIDRIYRLYGFGHWAVLARGSEEEDSPGSLPVPPGTLIGRIGFSAVTSAMEKELKAMGAADADADFGFLVAASCRGRGVAEEVCRAVLAYGFSQLGFCRVRADAHFMNQQSVSLLKKLGFVPLGRAGEKIVFSLDAP